MIKLINLCFLLMCANACAQKSGKQETSTSNIHILNEVILDTTWTEKIVKSDEVWKNELTTSQFNILRQHGTERPFSSALNKIKDNGTYVCAGCKNPLFSSTTKFDSGTGWPSFYQYLSSKSIFVSLDNSLGMSRDEVLCQRCGGHLGHVFNDGPNPTGLRYCMNGEAMYFVPEQKPMSELSIATFAGGCFWCTETIFESIRGVSEVISGYSGGEEENPTYEAVGGGKTSHAEAFQVYYDPKVITFNDLVRVFFASIDPTIVNGQGPDRGAQYRTIAFYNSEEEKNIIEDKISEVAKEYSNPIATQVVAFTKFWEAEAYHQDFVKRNPNQGYVRAESIPRRNRTLAKVKDLVK